MEKLEFQNACYEVLEILKYVKEDDLAKIPKEEIQLLKNNANYKHSFKYNPNLSMKEQNISWYKQWVGGSWIYFSNGSRGFVMEQPHIVAARIKE